MKVVIGTQSKEKLKRFKELFKGIPIEFLLVSDLGINEGIEETGDSVNENAMLKAAYYAKKTGLPCMSLDSGLFFIDYPKEDPIQVLAHVKSPKGIALNPIQMKEYYQQLAHEQGGCLKASWIDTYALYYQGEIKVIDNEKWARKDAQLTILDHEVNEWNEEYPIECIRIPALRKSDSTLFYNRMISEFSQVLGIELPRRVEVEEYNPQWELLFNKERMLLQEILKNKALAIYHIGSTSVKGLKAKPIIDILIVVSQIEEMDCYQEMFEFQGYEYLGEYGIAQRRYLRKRKIINGEWVDLFHLHIFDEDAQEEIERHLAVSKYLNAFSLEAKEYGDLKQKLSLLYPYDIEAYCDGKDEFVQKLEQRAIKWWKLK